MSNPFLMGPNVELRPLEESDAELFLPWLNDAEMRRLLPGQRYPKSLKTEREWISGMISQPDPPRNLAWAIERRSDAQLIGSVGMHAIDWPRRRAMTGIFIFPEAMRGKGYGTEAKNLVIDYAFGELGLHTLWATIVEGNAASARALEKQGYHRGGIFRKAFLVRGDWKDEIYFDLTHEDWEAHRQEAAASEPTPEE